MIKLKKKDTFTYLGPEAAFEGTIEFSGTILLDGKVNGKIHSNGGTVIVGDKAVIHADVHVGVAIVKGEVNGTILAQERIELKSPARVVGDIQAPEISIEERVVFNGRCAMESQTTTSAIPSETLGKKPVQDKLKSN